MRRRVIRPAVRKQLTPAHWGKRWAMVSVVLYLLFLLITRKPDAIVFVLGPLGFIVWMVQWTAYIMGGWIAAIIATVFLIAGTGYAAGEGASWIRNKIHGVH